jgi:hypothetical protein
MPAPATFTPPRRPDRWRGAALGALLALAAVTAHAALPDEIQVYTDDINAPGEFGLELHLNTTPRGLTAPGYQGEVLNDHGLRINPEFSWGLSRDWEAGLYLPVVRTGDGHWYGAGLKLRLKWLPLQPDKISGGWFAGVNTELSQLSRGFSQSERSLELRSIVGWRNPDWLFAANPIFGWSLSNGFRNDNPDFTLGLKASRKVSSSLGVGLEYYSEMGPLKHLVAANQQNNTLYLAFDYEGKPFAFNFGIGRGLSSAADAWTIKGIVEVPF